LISDPGNKQSQPILSGLRNLYADASRAINCRRYPHDDRGHFNWSAIRTMSANIKPLTASNFLIEMEESAGSGNVVSFSGLTPRRSILSASRNHDCQAQGHAQRESFLFVVIRSAHRLQHSRSRLLG